MLASSLLGVAGSALAWKFEHGSVLGCVFNGCLFLYAAVMYFWLPQYVERAGERYAESLFSVPSFSAVAKAKNTRTN
jgi:hypothetical protein